MNEQKGIEILQSLKREIDKLIEEKESRRKWYQETATKFLGKPVDVKFLKQPLDEFGNLLDGSVEQVMGRYIISIKSDIPIRDEHFTYAHEVAHAGLGHALNGTLKEHEQGKIFKEVFMNGTMNKATGIDARKIFEAAEAKQEDEADKIALMLMKMLWNE